MRTARRVMSASVIGLSLFALAFARPASRVGKTVVVKMIDKSATEYMYEPSTVSVQAGDIVQFVQTTVMPHNVEFRDAPAGADLGPAKSGEFLVTPNQKYELAIDKRFPKGTYRFVCVPHETLGMKGTLTVTAN